MKKRLIIYQIIIFSITINSGCINEMKFSEDQQLGEIVVNCLLSPDSLVKANVTNSRFFLKPDSSFSVVRGLSIEMKVNKNFKENLKLKGSNYVSTYRTASGDKITLIIKDPANGKLLTAETVVPKKAIIMEIDSLLEYTSSSFTTHDTILSTGIKRIDTLGLAMNGIQNFTIHFDDAPDTVNFYRISAILRHTFVDNKRAEKKLILYPNDLAIERIDGADIFDANSNRNFNIISDKLFDGKSYELKIYSKMIYFKATPDKIKYPSPNLPQIPVKSEIIFDLQAISDDFFNYLKTVKYNNTDLQYFSEPVQIYSNINNGTGILGGVTHYYYKVKLNTGQLCFFY